MSAEIRAAGAVLWRRADGGVEVCLVHRPEYDDWTLPKGKLELGEDFAAAARREVQEETGHVGSLGHDLGEVRYHVDKPGQRGGKVVRYWSMEAERGDFAPDGEVDGIAWLGLEQAARRLSYGRDRQVLERFGAALGG